jgi:5-methylcytosine-specific restriction endonuclease McrA
LKSVKVFGTELDSSLTAKWLSVDAHVRSQIGVQFSDIDTFEDYVRLANTIYDLNIDPIIGIHNAIDALWRATNGLSKSARKKLRLKNIGKVEYVVRPNSIAMQRVALKSGNLADSRKKKVERRERRAQARIESGINPKPKLYTPKDKFVQKPKRSTRPSVAMKDVFYRSWDWRTLRMEVLKERGARCECCGSTPEHTDMSGNPVKICVDHIKPLAKNWHLRLDKSNLQILCDECNQGKGAWDETDWRDKSAA